MQRPGTARHRRWSSRVRRATAGGAARAPRLADSTLRLTAPPARCVAPPVLVRRPRQVAGTPVPCSGTEPSDLSKGGRCGFLVKTSSPHGCAGRRATAVISTFAPPRRAAPTVVRTGRGSGKWRSYTALKRWKSDRSARWTRQDTTSAGVQPPAPRSAATCLAGQEHPLADRKARRVRPGRRGGWGYYRRLVCHSSSAIFRLRAASAASSR